MRLCTGDPACRGGSSAQRMRLRSLVSLAEVWAHLSGQLRLLPRRAFHLEQDVLAEGPGESTLVVVVHRPRLGLVFSVSVAG